MRRFLWYHPRMVCAGCGNQVREDAMYCSQCGNLQVPAEAPPRQETKREWGAAKILVAIGIIGCAACVLVWFIRSGIAGSQPSSESGSHVHLVSVDECKLQSNLADPQQSKIVIRCRVQNTGPFREYATVKFSAGKKSSQKQVLVEPGKQASVEDVLNGTFEMECTCSIEPKPH